MNVRKFSVDTALLLAILFILFAFIVIPKGYGFYTCFNASHNGSIAGKLKYFDFLFRFCRKELDLKGNYYFESK